MKMHKFNRFYLLGSIALALILPVLTIEVSSDTLARAPILSKTLEVQQMPLIVQPDVIANEVVQTAAAPFDWGILLLCFYGLITAVFVIRFVWSLFRIQAQINKNTKLKIAGASVVLLPDETLPHSFLSYIFLNEDEYKAGRIEAQLMEHELTHVRQMHSLDIIFIELLKAVFWFNPVFIFYKKAIQLNHEFLADEAVVSRYEVSAYQYLLLEKTNLTVCLPLASSLNYSLTKKRLTMMIKTTSKLKIWTARLAVVPILAVMLLSFSTKSVTKDYKLKPAASGNLTATAENPDEPAFFKGSTIWIENKDGKYMPKKYDEMTAAEKAALPAAPKMLAKVPTDEMFASWKTKTDVYTTCINDKYVPNSELAKYKAADIAYYSIRKPGNVDLRVNKNYGNAPNLVDMYTTDRHAKRFVEPYNKPGKWLAVYKGKIWPGGIDGASLINKYFELEKLVKNPNETTWLLPPFKPERIDN
jgi:hypothetical protein